ncbi:MAG TPA: phosphoribosylglycinamide formyltransferase [Hellea balneolensis]|uniref:Phosphoribosylglycinamide formyltransferase n=1 Tax=Hellea balneolensis TaxID=287478 RepID=A0A7V5U1D9_9PROT|nr:phosphoribosylglycinamide formyltransferase [Hellea balneolensis]
MRKIRTAILISGSGSNMEALIRAAQAPDYPAEIVLVISNRPEAAGLAKAENLGVPARAIDHKAYDSRKAFEQDVDAVLRKHEVELVCNAGFMRLLSPWFVGRWRERILNIHPALLPKFPGLHTHERALAAGETVHGCTIHIVDEGMDTGRILAQAKVPVYRDDTPETLAKRVLAQEHKLYPETLKSCASGLLNAR